jgi:hypothetical protein
MEQVAGIFIQVQLTSITRSSIKPALTWQGNGRAFKVLVRKKTSRRRTWLLSTIT